MKTLSKSHPPATKLSPEIDLLLCCARTHINAETKAEIQQLLKHPIDWTTFLQIAKRHGVLPLIFHTFNTADVKGIPPDVLAQLRHYAYATALHNTRLTQELLQLLQLFKAEGIAAIAFKGPILAASVYQNLGLRQFSDLDILVPQNHSLQVRDVLISQGYGLHKDLGWQAHYIHADRHLNIDLHHRITPEFFAFSVDFKALWSRLQPLSLGGATVAQLSSEDRLVLLCAILGKDCCHWDLRLAQLCDVAELLRHSPQLDWEQVWSQVHHLGCERLLLLDLCLIHQLLDVDLPDSVTAKLKAHPIIKPLSTWVQNRLWQRTQPLPDQTLWSFLWSYNHSFYFSVRERPQDKFTYLCTWLHFCFSAGFTPNTADREWLPLPQGLGFLYYVLHPLRLLMTRGIQPIVAKIWGPPQ